MVIYSCPKCDKKYTNKYDFMRHINRKTSCNKYVTDDKMSPQEISKNPHKILENIKTNKIEEHLCFYCGKNFVNKYNSERHTKLYCKTKKQHEKEKENTYNELIKRIENNEKKFENEIIKLKNQLNEEKIKNHNLNQMLNCQTNNVETTINKLKIFLTLGIKPITI